VSIDYRGKINAMWLRKTVGSEILLKVVLNAINQAQAVFCGYM
jgi:hypothetical protein